MADDILEIPSTPQTEQVPEATPAIPQPIDTDALQLKKSNIGGNGDPFRHLKTLSNDFRPDMTSTESIFASFRKALEPSGSEILSEEEETE